MDIEVESIPINHITTNIEEANQQFHQMNVNLELYLQKILEENNKIIGDSNNVNLILKEVRKSKSKSKQKKKNQEYEKEEEEDGNKTMTNRKRRK